MARVQYGSIVTEIKGKVQGHVFQGGNVGFVLRNKGYTAGISSPRRAGANAVISQGAAAWRSLSDAQRAVWDGIVSSWVFYNKFGAPYIGTGYQVYLAYNGYGIPQSGDIVAAPSAVRVPTAPGVKTLAYSLATGLVMTWDFATDANTSLQFFGSAPVSAGRNANHPRLKKIIQIANVTVTTVNLTSYYTAVFGVPSIGQRVIIRSFWQDFDWLYPYYDDNISCVVTA